jgi:hypothetical protein
MWPHGSLLGFLRLLRFRAHGRGIMIVDKDQKEVDYDPRFRLYLKTKLSNPQYQDEVAAQTTIESFMVTEAGLIIALSRCDRGEKRRVISEGSQSGTLAAKSSTSGPQTSSSRRHARRSERSSESPASAL